MPRVGCKIKGRHDPDSMIVQTIKIETSVPKHIAVSWLKDHGYKARLEQLGNYWHARQLDPSCFRKDTFRTIRFAPDAIAVIGKLKK